MGERQTKRGRPAIPDKWTRVISIRSDDLEKPRTFDIGSELLLDQSLDVSTSVRGRPPAWKAIYWPP